MPRRSAQLAAKTPAPVVIDLTISPLLDLMPAEIWLKVVEEIAWQPPASTHGISWMNQWMDKKREMIQNLALNSREFAASLKDEILPVFARAFMHETKKQMEDTLISTPHIDIFAEAYRSDVIFSRSRKVLRKELFDIAEWIHKTSGRPPIVGTETYMELGRLWQNDGIDSDNTFDGTPVDFFTTDPSVVKKNQESIAAVAKRNLVLMRRRAAREEHAENLTGAGVADAMMDDAGITDRNLREPSKRQILDETDSDSSDAGNDSE